MPPPFHGRNTGFEAGTAGAPSPLRWFLRLLYPKHHARRTTAAYRFYRSLTRDADLVAMEIAGLLLAVIFCIRPITDLRQRFVTVRIGVEAV